MGFSRVILRLTHCSTARETLARLLFVAAFALPLLAISCTASRTHHHKHTTHHKGSACSPTNDSPDAGFTRDMIVHHTQAVQMSEIARRRTRDPEIRNLAEGIILTQQREIGEMQGWLKAWGLPYFGNQPRMAWMGHPIKHGRMPGMASSKALAELHNEPPKRMDVQFLQLMIRHHEGALPMARAIIKRGHCSYVHAFARGVLVSQREEIWEMQGLMEKKGMSQVKSGGTMQMGGD